MVNLNRAEAIADHIMERIAAETARKGIDAESARMRDVMFMSPDVEVFPDAPEFRDILVEDLSHALSKAGSRPVAIEISPRMHSNVLNRALASPCLSIEAKLPDLQITIFPEGNIIAAEQGMESNYVFSEIGYEGRPESSLAVYNSMRQIPGDRVYVKSTVTFDEAEKSRRQATGTLEESRMMKIGGEYRFKPALLVDPETPCIFCDNKGVVHLLTPGRYVSEESALGWKASFIPFEYGLNAPIAREDLISTYGHESAVIFCDEQGRALERVLPRVTPRSGDAQAK